MWVFRNSLFQKDFCNLLVAKKLAIGILIMIVSQFIGFTHTISYQQKLSELEIEHNITMKLEDMNLVMMM